MKVQLCDCVRELDVVRWVDGQVVTGLCDDLFGLDHVYLHRYNGRVE